jgi:dephospho-CoA kinase
MIRLGLTGSIATGKSTVLAQFAELGIPVFSSDEAVHALYHGDAVPPIEALFPGVAPDGVIDRALLSTRLLQHPERLAELEAAVHPLVRRDIAAFLASAEEAGAPLAVVDIPLLFETGFDHGLDAVAVTVCDPEIQRERALARPGMTVEKLDAVLARQMPQEEKQQRADYVIDTSGSLEETIRMAKTLAQSLIAGSALLEGMRP